MSTKIATKKRKSADGDGIAAKKVKVAKSEGAAPPLKSALKKTPAASAQVVESGPKKITLSKKTASKAKDTPTIAKKRQDIVEEGDEGTTDLTEDQTAALLAGFSSSEDEAEDEDDNGIAINKLPKAPTTGDVQKRIKQAIAEQDDPETTPGVIYIGRVPHGFYEQQMRAYLSQFGAIKRLRLARNKRTGASRHFAFVEFASAAVADIVVKTMDKYLLFGHLLQVRRVPKEQIKEKMFIGAKKHPVPRNKMERELLNGGLVREDWDKRIGKENKRRSQKAEKLKEMGYDYDMPMAKGVDTVAVKPKAIAVAASTTADEPAPVTKDAPTVERVVEADSETGTVKETTVSKKRSAEGKPKLKKVVKKTRTSA